MNKTEELRGKILAVTEQHLRIPCAERTQLILKICDESGLMFTSDWQDYSDDIEQGEMEYIDV